MDYICLAAGKGTRFGRLGSYLQKSMYPVGLRPFLEYSLQNLVESEHSSLSQDRLTLVIGHHQEQVRRYFGHSYEGLTLTYVEQAEALGTAHALHLASQSLRPEAGVIVWLADLFVFGELFEGIYAHPAPNVLTVGRNPVETNDNVRVTLAGEQVTRAWQGEDDLYDIGLWKLSPELLALMLSRREQEYRVLPNVQEAVERGHQVGWLRAQEWLHLGGTEPSPEANVRAVVTRVLELSEPS